MSSVFIAGSWTGVGKTLLTCLAIRQARARGARILALKPVVTGFDPHDAAASDTGLLLRALGTSNDPAELDRISPWRFRAPLSPDMAAARENRSIPFDELVDYCREAGTAGQTLVEGVGGVMTPLTHEHTVLDWITALKAPTVLVTGTYLGSISHALCAWQVLRSREISVRSIVVSESQSQPVPTEETAIAIERFCEGAPVFILPRVRAETTPPDVTQMLGLDVSSVLPSSRPARLPAE